MAVTSWIFMGLVLLCLATLVGTTIALSVVADNAKLKHTISGNTVTLNPVRRNMEIIAAVHWGAIILLLILVLIAFFKSNIGNAVDGFTKKP